MWFHVIKVWIKITWGMLNLLHLLQHKRKLTWLDDEYGRWISKLIDIHRPTHHRPWRLDGESLIVPTKFISGDTNGWWSISSRWEPRLSQTLWQDEAISLLFLIINIFLLISLVILNSRLTLKVFMTSSGYFRALSVAVLVDNIPFIEFEYDMFI